MDPRDDEALWTLLSQSPSPAKPSPYFARRVLREVAFVEERRAADWTTRLRGRLPRVEFTRWTALWSGVLSGACAVVLLFVSRPMLPVSETTTPPRKAVAVVPEVAEAPVVPAEATVPPHGDAVPVTEVEVIADLDNILQREENRLWTEDTARY